MYIAEKIDNHKLSADRTKKKLRRKTSAILRINDTHQKKITAITTLCVSKKNWYGNKIPSEQQIERDSECISALNERCNDRYPKYI